MRISIYTKVMLLALGMIILFGFALGFYIIRQETGVLSLALDERATLIINNLSTNSEYPLLMRDRETIIRLVKGVLDQKDIVSCWIKDEYGNVFFEKSSNIVLPVKEFTVSIITQKVTEETEEEQYLGIPKQTEEEIGKIFLAVSLSGLNQKLSKITKTIVIFVIAAIIITSLALYFLLRRIMFLPVKQLVEATGKIAKGNIDYKVPIKTGDEIGTLASSFNKMTDDLKNTTVSRDYVDNIFKSMTDTLIVINPDATIKTVNQASLNLLGYKEDELIGKAINIIMEKEEKEEKEEEELFKKAGIKDLIKKGFIKGEEKRYLTKDGRKISVLFSGSVMHDNDGKIHGIVCAAHDITKRKQLEEENRLSTEADLKKAKELADAYVELKKAQVASLNIMEDLQMERTRLENEIIERKKLEQALSSEKEQLSVTLNSIGDGVIATDNKGNITMLNMIAQILTGWHQKEALDKPFPEVFHIINEMTREIAENPVYKVLESGKIVELANHTVLIARDGTERVIVDSAAPIKSNNGNIIGVVLVFRDITERKQRDNERKEMEIKMIATSKLASIGELATGVAHEINQPLTYISSFIQNLKIDLKDNLIDKNTLLEKLTISYKQILRINGIIQHLRTFGRHDDTKKQQVSIETILDNTLLIMGERIRLTNIELIKNIEQDLPMVSGNSNQLEQVFINLLQNALYACLKKAKHAEIRVDMLLTQSKDSVVIIITDNGTGIAKEELNKIFEPFFTTKEVGQGTGLGLSIVYGIIKEHNGSIYCESEVNKGTKFLITLPVSKIKD